MNVILVHISDIHLKEGKNSFVDKADQFFNAIKNEASAQDLIIFVITGDTSFSGTNEEFQIAVKILNSIKEKTYEYTGKVSEFVVIPGNHDCNLLGKDQTVRKAVLNGVREGNTEITNPIIQQLTEIQTEYKQFEKTLEGEKNTVIIDELFSVSTFELDNQNLHFLKLNTAWDSELHEQPGKMIFPIEKYSSTINQLKGLKIALLHHPSNWQNPNNSRKIKETILSNSTLILSGHEHTQTSNAIRKIGSGNSCYLIEAGALQDSKNTEVSEFQLIKICTEKNELNFKTFSWKRKRYLQISDTNETYTPKLSINSLQLNSEFENDLKTISVEFTHTTADEIELNDIYVEPKLVKLFNHQSKHWQYFNFNWKLLKAEPQFCLLGPESSGKTTLCKLIFNLYYEQGKTPILLSSKDIKNIDKEKLKRSIFTAFKRQYSNIDIDLFNQLDKKEVILIIDDFHLINMPHKYKATLLRNLTSMFSSIYYTGNDLMQFELFLDSDTTNSDLTSAFNCYKIVEFGPSQRNDLICKWLRIGHDSTLEQNDFWILVDQTQNIVRTLIGKNLVPSYPFYILCILQMSEASRNSTSASMHGYYYERLINNNIDLAVKNKDDVGFIKNFMIEYCNFLFENRIKFNSITDESFKKFVKSHNNKYATSESSSKILDILIKSKLLKLNDGNISVNHKYIYYYFVGIYLSKNIAKTDVKEIIVKMCQRLHKEEFANIILFITHLTSNQLIFDEILENAKKCFTDFEPIKLEEDVTFLNDLIKELPNEILSLENVVEDIRKQELEYQDEIEQKEKEFIEQNIENSEYSLDDDINALDGISRIVRAIKTIEIIGQLCRKYWGELEGNKKKELLEQAYLIGFRTLGFYFHSLKANQEGLAKYVRKLILKKKDSNDISKIEVENFSGDMAYKLASISTYGIIKKLADSIGHKKLGGIYDTLENELDTNAIRLTNIGISMEHFSGFPHEKIKSNLDNFSKYFIVTGVLRKLIVNHLKVFNTTITDKQKIAEYSGITIDTQRKISVASKQKKVDKKL